MNEERVSLQPQTHIELWAWDNASDCWDFSAQFVVDKLLSKKGGSSAMCYDAKQGSIKGILKEFYPRSDRYHSAVAPHYQIRREQELLRIAPEGEASMACFETDRERFLAAYQIILELKEGEKGAQLASFIPEFQIYYTRLPATEQRGTAYIWMPWSEVITFEKICHDARKASKENAEQQLKMILQGLEYLADCMTVLHGAGLVHRDIAPGNLGFKPDATSKQAVPAMPVLFDLDSIIINPSTQPEVPFDAIYTPGFTSEREARYPCIQTDIRGIGACLFYALGTNAEDERYQKELQGKLPDLVAESKLMLECRRAGGEEKYRQLCDEITCILGKCLCTDPEQRYRRCESLSADLQGALKLLTERVHPYGKVSDRDAFPAIQQHLYRYPLYGEEGNVWHLLLLGFDPYAQSFLESCLQYGQLDNIDLQIDIAVDRLETAEAYLEKRKALAEFFHIEKFSSATDLKNATKANPPAESYGTIRFTAVGDYNKENCSAFLHTQRRQNGTEQYIFVAAGGNRRNQELAELCYACKTGRVITCVRDCYEDTTLKKKELDTLLQERTKEGYYILPVGAKHERIDLFREIERMAMNIHLIWKKDLLVDWSRMKGNADFKKGYNFKSSVCSAVSLKYKLHSIGLDLDKLGFTETARRFRQKLDGDDTLRNRLIYAEHRRWVAEKVALGWQKRTVEECVQTFETKDEKKKTHICLVRSRPDQKLKELFSTYESWDDTDQNISSKLQQLDELDALSIILHREYRKAATRTRQEQPRSSAEFKEITQLATAEDVTGKSFYAAFQEWDACIIDLISGVPGRASRYGKLKNAFVEKFKQEMPPEDYKQLDHLVKEFHRKFYPIVAESEHLDWKQNDVAIVENTPFVLTFNESTCLIIPLQTGTSDYIFQNVAAATAINPAELMYLSYIRGKRDLNNLKEALSCIGDFEESRSVRGELLSLSLQEARGVSGRVWGEEREGEFIGQFEFHRHGTDASGLAAMSKELKQAIRGKAICAMEEGFLHRRWSRLLDGDAELRNLPSYYYNLNRGCVDQAEGCDALLYVHKSASIAVNDMVAFRGARGKYGNQPKFYKSYSQMWALYNSNPSLWKRMCRRIDKAVDNGAGQIGLTLLLQEPEAQTEGTVAGQTKENSAQELLLLQKNAAEGENYRTESYPIDAEYREGAERILDYLKQNGLIRHGEVYVDYLGNDPTEVRITSVYDNWAQYERLFRHRDLLKRRENMLPGTKDGKQLKLMTDRYRVDFSTGEAKDFISEKDWNDIVKWLNRLRDLRCLNALNIKGRQVELAFRNADDRELLSTEGKLLEVYVYHKLKQSGLFDDVVTSCEILRDTDESEIPVKNEFDCIVTRGPQMAVIECKAVIDLKQEYYHKLKALSDYFGINCVPVLIGDVRNDKPSNRTQISRGDDYGVVTVSSRAHIVDIDKTLLKIFEGSYDKTASLTEADASVAEKAIAPSAQKEAPTVERPAQKLGWDDIAKGQCYIGKVVDIKSNGAFIDFNGPREGFIYADKLPDGLSAGDEVTVSILKIWEDNSGNKRITLELHRWSLFVSKYKEGDEVSCRITNIREFAAWAEIIPGINGRIRISKISMEGVDNIYDRLRVGETVKAKIIEIDNDNKRVDLSMKDCEK